MRTRRTLSRSPRWPMPRGLRKRQRRRRPTRRSSRADEHMTPPLGLIEGFFGRPWRWGERRAAITALASHGYRFYLYAPKSDPYLRRRWQEPYPETEFEEIKLFSRLCRNEGVRFGIVLSPFELHLQAGSGWQAAL